MDSIAVLLGQQLSLGDVDHKSYDRYDEGICDQIREQISSWMSNFKTECEDGKIIYVSH